MRMNNASKNSADSTAILKRSKCACHGSLSFTLPMGEPMLTTARPWSASLCLISVRSGGSKSSTFLPATPRSSMCVTPFFRQCSICMSRSGEISSAKAASLSISLRGWPRDPLRKSRLGDEPLQHPFIRRGVERQLDGLLDQRRVQHCVGQFDGADAFGGRCNERFAVENGVHEILQHLGVLTAVAGERN